MAITSNWNEVRQGIIDAMSKHKNEFRDKALIDIKNRIDSKGQNSTINKNSVEVDALTILKYNEGKVYFDEVFKDINSQSWIDNI